MPPSPDHPNLIWLLCFIIGWLLFAGVGYGKNPATSSPPIPTVTPSPVGDMGFCALSGSVSAEEGGILKPLPGAEVSYERHSYVRSTSSGQTVTDENGHFSFDPIMIHDTDTIIVYTEFPGYAPQRMMRGGVETWPSCQFDILLVRDA